MTIVLLTLHYTVAILYLVKCKRRSLAVYSNEFIPSRLLAFALGSVTVTFKMMFTDDMMSQAQHRIGTCHTRRSQCACHFSVSIKQK